MTDLTIKNELDYYLAEQLLEKLYLAELITIEEKQTIHLLNIEKFKPLLAELLV
ncbi:SHOCT domain-containing protein [Facklamia languida]